MDGNLNADVGGNADDSDEDVSYHPGDSEDDDDDDDRAVVDDDDQDLCPTGSQPRR